MEKNNYKNPDAGCDKYGAQRLELAVYIRDNLFNCIENEWCIENGTLLGAWRNGKFIPHDDDFDFAMFVSSMQDIGHIYDAIADKIKHTKYKARLIHSYASKIEIYDDSYGDYMLLKDEYNGANYHFVTIDLQFYLQLNDNVYEKLYYIYPSNAKLRIDASCVFPVGTIELENETFNAPAQVEEFLKTEYGSLDSNASYNSQTGFYE
jgi:phosphorylcholine metabolism protein LicD